MSQPTMDDHGGPVPFDAKALGAPRFPQVNLLPPDVRSKRGLRKVKNRLALALLFVLLFLGLAFAWAALMQSQSADDLALKEAEVVRLQTEQAQYSEVPRVKGQIADATAARDIASSTEVLWKSYIEAIQAVAPADWTLKTMTTAMPTPTDPGSVSPDALVAPGVGMIAFTGEASTLPDVAAWMDALDSIPGFSGSVLGSAVATDDDGVSYYETSTTIQVDAAAFALRFAEEEGN